MRHHLRGLGDPPDLKRQHKSNPNELLQKLRYGYEAVPLDGLVRHLEGTGDGDGGVTLRACGVNPRQQFISAPFTLGVVVQHLSIAMII